MVGRQRRHSNILPGRNQRRDKRKLYKQRNANMRLQPQRTVRKRQDTKDEFVPRTLPDRPACSSPNSTITSVAPVTTTAPGVPTSVSANSPSSTSIRLAVERADLRRRSGRVRSRVQTSQRFVMDVSQRCNIAVNSLQSHRRHRLHIRRVTRHQLYRHQQLGYTNDNHGHRRR